MPVLQEEPIVFPGDLLRAWGNDDAFTFGEAPYSSRQWRVLYTKARHEKCVARLLLAQQVPYYLPTVRKKSYSRGRTITSYVAVFPGYVFTFSSASERELAWKTNRVVQVLDVGDGERLRRDLLQVQRLIESQAPMTVESRILPGQRVRVRDGALFGLEGTVLVRQGETRLVISVDFLQQGASVAIEDHMVEVIGM